MPGIHEAYAEAQDETLRPGMVFGPAPHKIISVGDVVTHIGGSHQHVYDPDLKVEGEHFVRAENGWQRLRLGISVGAKLDGAE